jgi:hypothetical protein
MSRTKIALFVCLLYAVIGVIVGAGVWPMLILDVVACAPLVLHYVTNQPSKEASDD